VEQKSIVEGFLEVCEPASAFSMEMMNEERNVGKTGRDDVVVVPRESLLSHVENYLTSF